MLPVSCSAVGTSDRLGSSVQLAGSVVGALCTSVQFSGSEIKSKFVKKVW